MAHVQFENGFEFVWRARALFSRDTVAVGIGDARAGGASRQWADEGSGWAAACELDLGRRGSAV